MKKIIVLALAVMFALPSAVSADPINLDTLPKSIYSKLKLQKKYLESLRRRYKMMYNRKVMDRVYRNLYNQREKIKQAQKESHVVGGVKSELPRFGELEQDKERVRKKNPYQVKAVNAKSVFLKRAMDYYVYNGTAGPEIMEMGNVKMRDHKVSRIKALEMMFKHKKKISPVLGETREIQKAMMDAPEYETTKERPVSYRTGDFKNNMISPFTSLKWLDN